MPSQDFEQRIRAKWLLGKVTSPQEAARLVKNRMAVGTGTGNSIACPKTFFTALADELGEKSKITLFTGGPVPNEVDGFLAQANAYQRRFGQFASAELLNVANNRDVPVIDTRTGILPHRVKDGRFGKIDIAVIEATAFTEDGYIIPSTSLLDAPTYTMLADKVIVEINTNVPEELEGIHDVYIPEIPPNRKPIPLTNCSDRIGTPYISVRPDKIAAIIESNIPDCPPSKTLVDEESRRIAELLIDFFRSEVKHHRLPPNLLPLQFGIGSIPEALAAELTTSSFTNIEFFTGTFGDGGLDLIDTGKARMLSTGSMYLSKDGFDRFYRDLGRYKPYIIIRPIVVSDCPELIGRLGVIAIDGAIEVDIYGHVNSTHIQGSRIISGIGGSSDFLWNAYLSIIVLRSAAREGDISCIVPMVTHVDQTEHVIDVIVTEQGLADLRGLAPVERAKTIIANCVHPRYKSILSDYLNEAIKTRGGHEPHMLEKAFSMHINFARSKTMWPKH